MRHACQPNSEPDHYSRHPDQHRQRDRYAGTNQHANGNRHA